jgi:flagellar biosynthesis anti-sigma factor FlgM
MRCVKSGQQLRKEKASMERSTKTRVLNATDVTGAAGVEVSGVSTPETVATLNTPDLLRPSQPARPRKVEAIRNAVADGSYYVSSADLADKLIDSMRKP